MYDVRYIMNLCICICKKKEKKIKQTATVKLTILIQPNHATMNYFQIFLPL